MKRRALRRRYGRTHVVQGPLVDGNVEWTRIPKSARVVEMTHGWVVHFADGRKATVFWGGDSREAQQWLRARAIKDARRR
jgi:hypothetical protein